MRTSGVVIVEPHDGGPAQIFDTIQCVHCQRHWIYVPRSRTRWGWCMRCHGVVCGTKSCAERCVPWEQELENLEKGRPEGHRPVIVAVPELPKGE